MTTASSSGLFRLAAVRAQHTSMLGEIVLIRPISRSFMIAGAFGTACAVLSFLVWGTYSEQVTLRGVLAPNLSSVAVSSSASGTIIGKQVAEGDRVHRGDVLYNVSIDQQSSLPIAAQESAVRAFEFEEASLQDQIQNLEILKTTERQSLAREIAAEKAAIAHLKVMIDIQHQRVESAQNWVVGSRRAPHAVAVSEELLIANKEDLLDQKLRLQSLERAQSISARELAGLNGQHLALHAKYENQFAELRRAIFKVHQELENITPREINVISPEDGSAVAVVGEVGERVDSRRPLLSIVPQGAFLQAQLYAPNRAVGSMEIGDTVLVRYQAYPYQNFGHQKGRITGISHTPVAVIKRFSDREDSSGQVAQPLYLVTVDLAAQTITAHGEQHELRAGMRLEADVIQDRRPLYEWTLDPLHTLMESKR